MQIKELDQKPAIEENIKFNQAYLQFEKLLIEMRKKELPDSVVVSVNKDIDELNALSGSGVEWRITVRKKQTSIIKLLEKDLKVVPKNYYRNVWLTVGMAAFGIPLGVAFGVSFGNMAFLGIGLPIGMALGIAVGTGMDKKASEEGRQLDLEIK